MFIYKTKIHYTLRVLLIIPIIIIEHRAPHLAILIGHILLYLYILLLSSLLLYYYREWLNNYLIIIIIIVVWLTSFFGTYETVLYLIVLMSFCLPSSLELGIILLDFVLVVVCSVCSRLLLWLWESVLLVGSFWGFTFLSIEGFSTGVDGSKTLRVSDL